MEKQVSYPFVRIAAASKLNQTYGHTVLLVRASSIVGIVEHETFEEYMSEGVNTHDGNDYEAWYTENFDLKNQVPIYEVILEESCWRNFGFDNAWVLAHPESRETISHLQTGMAQHLRDFAVILEHAPRLLRLVQKELEQSNAEAEHSRKRSRLEKGRE